MCMSSMNVCTVVAMQIAIFSFTLGWQNVKEKVVLWLRYARLSKHCIVYSEVPLLSTSHDWLFSQPFSCHDDHNR